MFLRFFILFCFVTTSLSACGGQKNGQEQISPTATGQIKPVVISSPADISFTIESVASGLEVPWDMVFTSPQRMLITERPGRLRQMVNGVLDPLPLKTFEDISNKGEEGLMSVVLDPEYEKNKWIYLSWAYSKGNGIAVKVSRFTDLGDRLEDEFPLIESLPAARFHAGCRLGFGPDGKLYITVGDAFNKKDAQKLDSLAGKILRLNKDGSIPSDNPLPQSPVWSYGHRNPQGLAWHPETGELYETEHGPSLIDGPAGGDEVNHIVKGANYGWPVISHDESQEGMKSPLISFTPAEPPGSLLIYSGVMLPPFKNNLFFGSLKGEGLMRLQLDPGDGGKIVSAEKIKGIDVGRIRTVIEGPDGLIYFSTSNRDDRGKPSEKDDQIYKMTLVP